MKIKQLFKRAAATVMAAVTVLFLLPATAFAATGDVGTISFTHTYDSAGNVMYYNSSAVINGYTAGGAGKNKFRMYVDGSTAFCIQPGVPLKTGNQLTRNSSETWNALSASQKKAVGLALLYGYQGNRDSLTGSDDEKWLATQTLVWEFVTGCRNASGSFQQTDSTVYSLHFGSNYPNSGAAAAYDQIVSIRLPNNAFKANAGTEVTSDIIFLQKRDRMTDIEPDWVHLDTDENGIRMNRYFVQHPEMVLGDMVMESTRFGMDSTCRAYEDADLSELIFEAVQNLHAQITDYEVEELDEEEDRSIPADPAVRNFSFCLVDGKVYYRENSRMHPIEVSVTAENRIRGMIAIRECVRRLIEYQTEGYPDEDIQKEQAELNRLYDDYTKKYGLLSSRGNSLAFGQDSSYCLLCSLEVLDEEGNLKRKADMFTKRTIRPHEAVTSVDTASEALAVSISEKARVDMEYMAELSGKSEEELAADLSGVIFRDIQCAEEAAAIPKAFVQVEQFPFVAADEYLSGNVRRKLRMAKALYEVLPAEKKPLIAKNIEALEAVQPVDLTAAEIGVRIGANWIPIDVYQKFMVETFGTSYYAGSRIKILRSGATGQWAITEKNADRGNIKTLTTYGTKRMNAYQILEQTLNQRDVRVFDYVEDENGNKKPVLNKKETAIAQDRQELIKQKFSEWIWKDIDRRERLCRIYNETFNSIRPREYDGSHIRFSGMNPEITLRPHQVNAIAHIMYGGNTLLAHEVGAGKSATRS